MISRDELSVEFDGLLCEGSPKVGGLYKHAHK